MTMEEAHRKMWNDLADGKVEDKREWLDLYNTNNEDDPYFYCFACEEARTIKAKADRDIETYYKKEYRAMTYRFNNGICDYCPLGGTGNSEKCLHGLFDKWINVTGFEKFRLAHEIANLPWEDVDNE